MKELRAKIYDLANEELERANSKFPPFNSTHEAYAVLLEEAEESEFEMACVKEYMGELWQEIKRNKVNVTTLHKIRIAAVFMAAESVQTAAMAQKFLDFLKKGEGQKDE